MGVSPLAEETFDERPIPLRGADGIEAVDLFRLFTGRPDGLNLIEDGNHPYGRG